MTSAGAVWPFEPTEMKLPRPVAAGRSSARFARHGAARPGESPRRKVILLYPLVVLGAAAVFVQRRGRPGARGWAWFGAWAAAGALFTFSFLTGFSVGLFLLPLAAGALFFVASRAAHLGEALGFAAGTGVILLVIAYLSRDHQPCPEDGSLSIPAGAPPGTSVACGGFDPIPWLLAGSTTLAASIVAYAVVRTALRRARARG